jgi:hypothetical protein
MRDGGLDFAEYPHIPLKCPKVFEIGEILVDLSLVKIRRDTEI